jgi:membrane-associated protein
MQGLVELWHRLSDLQGLIQWGGYFVLTAIVFAETGLLVGFFLPGDSLLVTAGLLASQGYLNVYLMGVLLSVAAILGQSLGYAIGKAAGAHLFTREDSLLFKRSHLLRAHEFYEKHGAKTVVIARFMPIVRTFVPVVAGAADMRYRDFTVFNVVGGLLWVWSMLFTGYVLGRYIPGVEKRIDLVIVLVVLLSISPGVIAWLRRRRSPRGAADTAVAGPRTTFSEE